MPGNISARENNNQAFWGSAPLLPHVTIRGKEGNMPFLTMVQGMKMRHVYLAFKSVTG